MSYTLQLRPAAIEDIQAASEYYDQQKKGLGDDFLESLADLLLLIESNPNLFALQEGSIRRGRMQRFPYQVYYLVVKTDIEVLAVLHESRHPDSWRNR